MSYVCYATKKLVSGIKSESVVIKQRKVNYNNYLVYQRGNKIYKQYMGTSNGFEPVEEAKVNINSISEFLLTHVPETVAAEKTVTYEYMPRFISAEAYEKALLENNVVILTELPRPEPEPDQFQDYNDRDKDGDDY